MQSTLETSPLISREGELNTSMLPGKADNKKPLVDRLFNKSITKLVGKHILFIISVAIPLILSTLYFGLFASDVYVSESTFIIRSSNKQQASSGLASLLAASGGSFSIAHEDSSAVKDFILSRDALGLLDKNLEYKKLYSSSQIFLLQKFNPFGWDDSFEKLFKYYLKQVQLTTDHTSPICKLTVKSFKADSSQKINQVLLQAAESLVNEMNNRSRKDLITFAQNEVDIAEQKSRAAAMAMSNYRNTQDVVQPVQQAKIHLEQLAKLQENLISTKAQLEQIRTFAPNSPHPRALELRIQTLEREIKSETQRVTGGPDSLASKAAEYERLALEVEFADKLLAASMAGLESARNQAQRQTLYLETIAKPSLPDEPILPERIRGIITTLVLGLVAWGILSMLLAGVREHQY